MNVYSGGPGPESRWTTSAILVVLWLSCMLSAKAQEAPPGMFKDLDNATVGGALLIHGKQLFIDDDAIERLDGVEKVLHQPARHRGNPLITADRPWEGQISGGSVLFDEEVGFYRMWYGAWSADHEKQVLCYATSPDGIAWRKPVTSPALPWRPLQEHDNIVFGGTPGFGGASVFKDPHEPDAECRYKMLYRDRADGTERSHSTSAACSPDGILWEPCDGHPSIPLSETHKEHDGRAASEQARFIPRGGDGSDWDGGGIQPFHAPMVIGDEMRIYYAGHPGDGRATSGIGLATLRLDGSVSVDAGEQEGSLTTRLLVFTGDTLEINADADGGSIVVEVRDAEGKVIDGFARADCEPMATDSVRHTVRWRGSDDCHRIQARPVRLKFHLRQARLYAFTPRIQRNHNVQSYE